MISVHDQVRRAEQNFLQGTTKLGKYVSWSMHDTIETIDAYLNSKHISPDRDSLGREKPFFNIVTAATNLWWRGTDISRKDIRFIPQNSSSVVLAFVANVLLQKWMDDNNFGQFLKNWGRALARYGSAVSKFVVQNDKLSATVIPWNRFIPDPIDFDSIPHVEKFYLTPGQLRLVKEYDQDQVDALINAVSSRKTLDKMQQDAVQNNFIEVYEVHGLMDARLLEEDPDTLMEDSKAKYSQQMHVISYVRKDNEDVYDDFTLYKGKESKDPYSLDHLIEEDGRTLSIGAVEYLFDAQWMVNHSIKNIKDTLDLASKLIFQTSDANFAARNVLSAIETGDILIHQVNMPLERIANDKPDIGAQQGFLGMWEALAKEITGTPDAMRGQGGGAGKQAARLAQIQIEQAQALFSVMQANKGLALEQIFRKWVIPHIKRQLKHKDEVVAILDDAGIKQIDAYYIPRKAIQTFNDRTLKQVGENVQKLTQGADPASLPPIAGFDPAQEQQGAQQQLAPLGNTRFFKPDDLDKKTWDELFSDFEWDAIKIEITDESEDTQVVLQTLSTALQSIATNPAILQDPNAKLLFNKMLITSGVVSPLEMSTTQATPAPIPAQAPQQMQPQQAAPRGGT